MSLEAAMRDFLLDSTSLVRIYPMGKRPQEGELPALTYQLVSGPTSHYSHRGVSDHEVSYQLDCWADDADVAMDTDTEVRDAFDGFRGWWGSYRIGSCFLSIALDDHEPKTGLYRRLRQVDIHYSQPDGS